MKHYHRVRTEYDGLRAELRMLQYQQNNARKDLQRAMALDPRMTTPQDLLTVSDDPVREYMATLLGAETTDVQQLVNRIIL